ncbi:MAG: cyclodeaminase/cyclohydrolase family protein [Candidatus Omnitrophica bacterium]|nr:cyclodeaminase/cyclohydrolase family protein [Candidatus Omnitrophota bacterium]
MKLYQNHTLKEYIHQLGSRAPVPGGGSAAALSGALGAALISMVAEYSRGKTGSPAREKKNLQILKESQKISRRFLEYVDLDAQAYLQVVRTRKSPERMKKAALKKAQAVPLEVCKLAYQTLVLTPFLVEYGNPHLVSDVEVAIELLLATFESAMINVKINQL